MGRGFPRPTRPAPEPRPRPEGSATGRTPPAPGQPARPPDPPGPARPARSLGPCLDLMRPTGGGACLAHAPLRMSHASAKNYQLGVPYGACRALL